MEEDNNTGGNKPLSKSEQDRTDLANETADRDVGRQQRFLPDDANPARTREKRAREHERLSALMSLLQNDPEYAALHKDAMEKLRRYELAAERALQDAIKRGDLAEADRIRRYQVDVLGHARDRLTDEEDPPTKDEIEEIIRNIERRANELNVAPDAGGFTADNSVVASSVVAKPPL